MTSEPLRTVQPIEIDFRKLWANRDVLLEALKGQISPMFVLSHHGLESAIEDLIQRLVIKNGKNIAQGFFPGENAAENTPNCLPLEISSIVDRETEVRLHCGFCSIVEEVVACLLGLKEGGSALRSLLKQGPCPAENRTACESTFSADKKSCISDKTYHAVKIGGRQSVRCYPHQGGGKLGAHVDMNLLTLLWSNGPGLEVLDPSISGISPTAVRRAGMPTTFATDSGSSKVLHELGDDGWVTVDADWASNVLLVTFGDEWFRAFVDHSTTILPQSRIRNIAKQILCPVYHRVNKRKKYCWRQISSENAIVNNENNIIGAPRPLGKGVYWDTARFSLPFLARLVDVEPQKEKDQDMTCAKLASTNVALGDDSEDYKNCSDGRDNEDHSKNVASDMVHSTNNKSTH